MNHLRLVLILITFLKVSFMFSQNGSISLDYFNIIEYNGNVFIDITLSEGNTCNGIHVQRSLDTINFEEINFLEGICGNTSSPTSYNFLDENPILNKTSYYRVEFGNNIFSEIIEILIIDNQENKYQIRPNPSNEETTLYFNSQPGNKNELLLFNIYGTKILSLTSLSNQFYINTSSLNNGLYIFLIKQGSANKNINGQLIVKH